VRPFSFQQTIFIVQAALAVTGAGCKKTKGKWVELSPILMCGGVFSLLQNITLNFKKHSGG
jgi:hypothetical protein